MAEENEMEAYASFLKEWVVDPVKCREVLLRWRSQLEAVPGVEIYCRCRPGVSFSLRAKGAGQTGRELFVMVDVVDDDPASRWLSVCFYDDLVTDPDDVGDWVPAGLNGEDAHCFNYDEESPEMEAYIAERLREAAEAASQPGAK